MTLPDSEVYDLYSTLHQMASFAGMLEALRLDAEEKQDFALFVMAGALFNARNRGLQHESRPARIRY